MGVLWPLYQIGNSLFKHLVIVVLWGGFGRFCIAAEAITSHEFAVVGVQVGAHSADNFLSNM